MFKMTAMVGKKERKELQYSQDSRMMVSPCPTRWPAPSRGRVPPIITVGSRPAAMAMWVHMEVVVVFPWVPEMHRAWR